jgi:hypothetical protein
VVAGAVLGVSKEMPLEVGCVDGVGVLPLDLPGSCSPNLIKASTALSKFPFSPFSTVELRLSSGKPISRSCASFESMPSPEVCMLEPKTLEGLLIRGGD